MSLGFLLILLPLQNTDGKPRDISEATVKDYLSREAYACQYGGKSKQEKVWEIMWVVIQLIPASLQCTDICRYSSDPNPGECVSSNPNSRRSEDIAVEFEA